jgi:hypothetical protein
VLTGAYHAEVGRERGEWVIGNLGTGGGDRADKGGFSGVRQPGKADVGQYLEFEVEIALLA